MNHKDGSKNGTSLGYDVPHIDIGLATRNDEVEVEGGDGEESATDAEDLHEMGRGKPLLLEERDDELRSDKRQTEHHGEGDERGEAQHLGEGSP